MHILCVGDVHCKASNLPLFREMMRRVETLARGQAVDAVWLSGDVFDRHAEVHISCIDAVQNTIKSLLKVCPVWVSVGNHDCATNSEPVGAPHALMVLRGLESSGLVIADRATMLKDITIAPYRPPGELISHLDEYAPSWRASTVILCHQEMRGVKIGPIPSERGDDWTLDLPLAICGHIHDKQWLRENVYYVGTPANHTFGESLDKTVTLLDTDTKEVREVSLDLPRKITVDVAVDAIESLEFSTNDITRVRISGPSSALVAARKDKKISKILAPAGQVMWIPTDDEIIEHATRQSYDQELLSMLASETPQVMSVFKEIFG